MWANTLLGIAACSSASSASAHSTQPWKMDASGMEKSMSCLIKRPKRTLISVRMRRSPP